MAWCRTAGLMLALLLWGCSTHYVDATAQARALADEGQEPAALQALEQTAQQKELDELLLLADRGALLHRAGEWERSAQVLNQVARLADRREVVTLGDEFFGRAPWRMGTLERQALHTLNTLNYLQLGDTDSALVEARLTDSLLIQARIEAEARAQVERGFALVPFDQKLRRYLEQLVIGRYLSGLAHELDGNEDSAFIDYYQAFLISQAAPPGAPSSVEHLVPSLLARARRLERPELPTLEKLRPDVAAEQAPAGTGEVVVVIEAGKIPERFVAGAEGSKFWTVRARDWARGRAVIEVGEQTAQAETVTSLENLLLRRGALGALTDTERVASSWVNVALLGSYVLLPPVGGALLLRRVFEVHTRMAQGWLSLPAEFQVGRLRLPAGTHEVRVVAAGLTLSRTVEVAPGRPSLVVVRVP
jgi:uncharacterized protein